MWVLGFLLSVLIGVSLGLLGGGGSILTVPILMYVLGMPPKSAIATSLLVVGGTSLVGLISHARAGRVRPRTGLLFGVAGMAGAYLGGLGAQFLPARVLLLLFAGMMGATALAMLRKKDPKEAEVATKTEVPVVRVLVQGAAVGAFTGLVGAGGGFVVVPALTLLGGLPMREAVGTSLLVIAMQSFAGFFGYLGHVPVDLRIAALVLSAAVIGILIGGRLSARVSQGALRKGFGWFVLAMAVFLLLKELLS